MSRSGQAYLESLLAVLVILAALFGGLETAFVFGEKILLRHAASRAARARTVGFNEWMAEKAARVAAIPLSGRLRSGEIGLDAGAEAGAVPEFSRIPFYLAAENRARAEWILDYDEWRNGSFAFSGASPASGGVLEFTVRHDMPLEMPLAPLFVPGAWRDSGGVHRARVSATGVAADHASTYLRGSR